MFTTLTIIASAIMFKVDFPDQAIHLADVTSLSRLGYSKEYEFFYCTILLYNVQDWSGQNASSIASEVCGFITVLSGTIILHATREQEAATASGTNT